MRKAENLRVVEVAMQVAELTYAATRVFPADERFGLISQMRRAAVSIGSNISEGCGRSSSTQLLHFLQIAAGSATELEYQARLSERLAFGDASELMKLRALIQIERRMIGRLVERIRAAPPKSEAAKPPTRAEKQGA
jgi:four helix bundle protein